MPRFTGEPTEGRPGRFSGEPTGGRPSRPSGPASSPGRFTGGPTGRVPPSGGGRFGGEPIGRVVFEFSGDAYAKDPTSVTARLRQALEQSGLGAGDVEQWETVTIDPVSGEELRRGREAGTDPEAWLPSVTGLLFEQFDEVGALSPDASPPYDLSTFQDFGVIVAALDSESASGMDFQIVALGPQDFE